MPVGEDRLARLARRSPGLGRVRLRAFIEAALYDLQRQESVPLLPQDPPQALDVGFVELPVTRRRPLGIHQSLALKEADLGDGDVRELLLEEGQDFPD
jgi:hypothetical protein